MRINPQTPSNNLVVPSWYYGIIVGVIAIDQSTKLWVHTHMQLKEEQTLFNWPIKVNRRYRLNPGVPGVVQLIFKKYIKFSDLLDLARNPYVKIPSTLFTMSFCIGSFLLFQKYMTPQAKLSLWASALILGGVIGNTIDMVFYGVLLNNSIVKDCPTRLFCGQIIDFICFDNNIIPIFNHRATMNIADISIMLGLMLTGAEKCKSILLH